MTEMLEFIYDWSMQEIEQKTYTVIPIQNGVAFPYTDIILTISNKRLNRIIKEKYDAKEQVLLSYENKEGEVSDIGTIASLGQVLENEIGLNIISHGMEKVRIEKTTGRGFQVQASIEKIADTIPDRETVEALVNHSKKELQRAINLGKILDFIFFTSLLTETDPIKFSYQLAFALNAEPEEKQRLLETTDTQERLERVGRLLEHEIKVLEIEQNISEKTKEKFSKDAKEAVLRERLREIKKELGEEPGGSETEEIRRKILKNRLPIDIEAKALSELERLVKMGPMNPEATYVRNYLDWLTELPWNRLSQSNINLKEARDILDADHYGLEKAKERILEYLAVLKLRQVQSHRDPHGPENILCFVGPPGVGKTSIGQSIAKALNRKFISMSLGGIRDEAEIRGHRRTYVGAMPGRIIQQVRNAGTKNPVFILDEIDKITDSFMGNPSAAFLEVLDPAQNYHFQDNYLEVPFDLSDIFFITTGNVLDTIPPALRDRMEIIEFPGYTEDEKLKIAQKFLIKKELTANGLAETDARISDEAILDLIRNYTREAGVRNLDRSIASIFRKAAKKKVEDGAGPIEINESNLNEFLGPRPFHGYLASEKNEIGAATGLAWTQFGGEIVFIEVATMPGSGQLILTGQLGQVMQESCKAALSYIRSHTREFDIKENFNKDTDIHVHVPEGASPKDGPSAGVAILTAMVSALSGHPVRKEVGMTGEITLRGKILEISGVKEKILAAQRANLKQVFLPSNNQKDVLDIPAKIINEIDLKYVDHVDQILREAIIK